MRNSLFLLAVLALVILFVALPTSGQNTGTSGGSTNGASAGQSGIQPSEKKDLTFGEKMALAIVPVVITSIFGLLGIFISVIITFKRATRDKSAEFRKLNPGNIDINDTDWDGTYTDARGFQQEGSIQFEQFGNRFIGKWRVPSLHRTWTIEGIISNRRISYIYHDDDPSKVSFGTTMLEFDGDGDTLTGIWNGWTPSGNQFNDLQVTLIRRKK